MFSLVDPSHDQQARAVSGLQESLLEHCEKAKEGMIRDQDLLRRFWSRIHKTEDCWVWTASSMRGYGRLTFSPGRSIYAHRLSYEIHFGPIPAGLYICHKCDNPRCCRPSHLFAGTAAQNTMDAWVKGRLPLPPPMRGEANPKSKLTDKMVLKLLNECADAELTQVDLARKYGISRAAIWNILHGMAWRSITNIDKCKKGPEKCRPRRKKA